MSKAVSMKIIFRRWVGAKATAAFQHQRNEDFLNPSDRRQFYGKDYISTKDDDHVFNMGFRWSERVREHVATRLQRCCGNTFHVRPLAKVNPQLSEGMVSPSAGIQQGTSASPTSQINSKTEPLIL